MLTISITVISDPVCPWCYIGALRLSRAISLYRKTVSSRDTVTTRWHAYQLDPGATTQPLVSKMASRFGDAKLPAIKTQLLEIARREGLEFNLASTIGSTRDAHRLEKLARKKDETGEEELETRLALEVMRMYFEQGGDITSIEDLGLAAERAGIDRDEARAWLEGDEGGEEVDREVAEAQRMMNVKGVPQYLINGKFVVDGGQPVEEFLEQLVMARDEALKNQ
ncbi:hypothetical protein ACJ41O_011491 [Fusarium nematophilum]